MSAGFVGVRWQVYDSSPTLHVPVHGPIACPILVPCEESDVRVHGGKAYTATAGLSAVLFGTFLIIVTFAVVVRARCAAGS